MLDVPLIGWDLLTDIVVLDPVQPRWPIELSVYPGEVELFPQPTISRGILSRYRRWPDQEVTYLQTDAAVDGGQSGGGVAVGRGWSA